MNEELLGAHSELMKVHFSGLSQPIRKNLVVLTFALLFVLSAVRSGQGRLSLAALTRALPTEGSAYARERRLHRLLKNPRLDFRTVTGSLATILLPPGKRFCPVILGQPKSASAQALLAAIPYAGRSLPLACHTLTYPLMESTLKGQNQLEHIFLPDTETALPPGVRALWIADPAYARSLLLQQKFTCFDKQKESGPWGNQERKIG